MSAACSDNVLTNVRQAELRDGDDDTVKMIVTAINDECESAGGDA